MNVIFSGEVSAQAQAGETVTVTVTLPNGTKDTLTATTLADKTYSVTKQYVAGSYSAVAHGDADAENKPWDSPVVSFVVELADRTGTLIVTLA